MQKSGETKAKRKSGKKSQPIKKRTGNNHYIGKYEHIFNKKWTEDEIKILADELIDWMEKETKNLWFKDFLIEKRIDGKRFTEFCNKSDYFNSIYSLCKGLQESRMFKLGTSKTTNPAMFILGLKNNHGWTDRNEVSMTGKLEGIKFVE